MQNNQQNSVFPDWKVWTVFLVLTGWLLGFLFFAERDFINPAIDKQNNERIQKFTVNDTIPTVVFIGSSLLKHAIPFDQAFDTRFREITGKQVKSLRMVRYQGSINQFGSALKTMTQAPPDFIYIDKAAFISNDYQVNISVGEYFRFQFRKLLGTKENTLTFALQANSEKDEKLFRRTPKNTISLDEVPDSAALMPKIYGLFHQASSKKPILSEELTQVFRQLLEKGTKIRVLSIPRLEAIDTHPLLLAFDQRLQNELDSRFGNVILQKEIEDRPPVEFYCDPGHLNVSGRDFFAERLVRLIEKEVYGNPVN